MLKLIRDTAFELIKLAITRLPKDVSQALLEAYELEYDSLGKAQLKAILDNVKIAEDEGRPMCQDTGLIMFYVDVGDGFGLVSGLEEALTSAVRKATVEIPLRPNVVDPFTRENSNDNTGLRMPYINWGFVQGDSLKLTVLPKGAGSENVSSLKMLKPTEGALGIKNFILKTVLEAGGQPCPPVIVGVGIGGSFDIAASLAKKAILKPLGEPNPDPYLAKLEDELLEAINSTGVGPMGLGGRSTALGVNIEYAYTHTACLPVAVNIQCWAARRASAYIYRNGFVEYLDL